MNVFQAFADGLRAALGVPAIVYALGGIGLDLQYGYGGLLNVGQVGFMLVGAYGTAVSAQAGLPIPLAVLVGLAAAVVLGVLLGLTSARVRGDQLAIVTLAAAEILRLLARSTPLEGLTGGVSGVRGFADDFYRWNPIPVGRYGVGDVAFSYRTAWVILLGWGLVALAAILVRTLGRSPWGRLLVAVREDEVAVRAAGKDALRVKVQALAIGGAIGALGGAVLAIDAQFVDPDTWTLAITTYLFTVVVLGGRQTGIGPVVGSMAFWFLLQSSDTLLRQALEGPIATGYLGPNDAGPIRIAAVGLALIVVLVRWPGGLLGTRGRTPRGT